MIPVLRDYQNSLDNQIYFHLGLGCMAPLVVAPTGGGKTLLEANLASQLPGRVWVLAHRKELIDQGSKKLGDFEVEHGVIKAKFPEELDKRVQMASVQTVVRRLDYLPPPDWIVVDEAHHVSATYQKIFAHYPDAPRIGFTATPCLLNGKGLYPTYHELIEGPTVSWLMDQGHLKHAKYYAPPVKADLSNLPKRGGDFAREANEAAMNQNIITGDAIEHYRRVCEGVPMIVFCTSVKHANDVAEGYRKAGYRAAAVDGNLDDAERGKRIEGLGNGEVQILTSCDLIGEGLDIPVCGAVQLLRPTASLGLHRQQIGRGLRPAAGQTHCYVLDHVGNTGRMVNGKWVQKHGFAETEYEWTLAGVSKKPKKTEEKPISVRTCSQCFSVHQIARSCPYCQYEYPVKGRGALDIVAGDLEEIKPTKEWARQATNAAKTYDDYFAIAKRMGYDRPSFWALKKCGRLNHKAAMPRY